LFRESLYEYTISADPTLSIIHTAFLLFLHYTHTHTLALSLSLSHTYTRMHARTRELLAVWSLARGDSGGSQH